MPLTTSRCSWGRRRHVPERDAFSHRGSTRFNPAGDLTAMARSTWLTAKPLSANVTVLLGNGDGTFNGEKRVVVGVVPISIAAPDLNGDGKIDLVTANYNSNDVSVLWKRRRYVFSPTDADCHWGFSPLHRGVRPERRRKVDLVTANQGSNDVSVLLGNVTGPLQAPMSLAAGKGPGFITALT